MLPTLSVEQEFAGRRRTGVWFTDITKSSSILGVIHLIIQDGILVKSFRSSAEILASYYVSHAPENQNGMEESIQWATNIHECMHIPGKSFLVFPETKLLTSKF